MEYFSPIDGQLIAVQMYADTKYGIMLSGGIDSAVLLYAMIRDFKAKNIPVDIQPFMVPGEGNNTRHYCDLIRQFMLDKHGVQLPEIIEVGGDELHHSKKVLSGYREIFKSYDFGQIMYQGTNQNPPRDFDYSQFESQDRYPNRVHQSEHPRVVLPFIHLNKHHIMDLMFYMGAEGLADITHSCTEQPNGRCGKCFQCQERAWAFRQINKIDTGSL